jgi:RNA polymerase sigma factor (sigma-70 family)
MTRHHDLLTAEQERAYGLLWARDRNPEGVRRLVEGNHRLVRKETQRFEGLGVDTEDLLSEGTLGLVEAAKRFDPSRGLRFGTHAHAWIHGALTRAVTAHGAEIRLPERKRRALSRLATAEARLGPGATTEALAEALDTTVEEIEGIREMRTLTTTSADQPVGEDGASTVGDLVAAEGASALDEAEAEERHEVFRELFTHLQPEHREILALRYGLDDGVERTMEEVGVRLGLSREAARQRVVAALGVLREAANA